MMLCSMACRLQPRGRPCGSTGYYRRGVPYVVANDVILIKTLTCSILIELLKLLLPVTEQQFFLLSLTGGVLLPCDLIKRLISTMTANADLSNFPCMCIPPVHISTMTKSNSNLLIYFLFLFIPSNFFRGKEDIEATPSCLGTRPSHGPWLAHYPCLGTCHRTCYKLCSLNNRPS